MRDAPTPEERARELAMMTTPERWPYLDVLPLKNRSLMRPGQIPPLGVLTAEDVTNGVAQVHLRNMLDRTGETLAFANFEALLDAGWVVD